MRPVRKGRGALSRAVEAAGSTRVGLYRPAAVMQMLRDLLERKTRV